MALRQLPYAQCMSGSTLSCSGIILFSQNTDFPGVTLWMTAGRSYWESLRAKTFPAYLAGESHGLGEGVDPLAVFCEFLLILERCHLQLAVHGGKLCQESLLPLVCFYGLLLELPIQDDHSALQRAVVRLQGSQAAVAIWFLLLLGEHQPAAALANLHRSVVARLPHVSIHVPQVEHLAASSVPALRRGVVAHLGVLGQMLQLHHGIAAPRMVIAFNLQLQDEVL